MAFYGAFQWNAFQWNAFQVARNGNVLPPPAPNGNRPREYQPRYHELKELREIERKFEEAQLTLKSTQIKIEDLEFKRLSDLADRAMQLELMQLLAQQNELEQLINQLQQQKLRALNEDNDFIMLLMALPN